MDHDHQDNSNSAGDSKMHIAFFVLLAIAGFFLLTEHRAHVFGILPYLLLLACPLMHIFGHHGHGHGHGNARKEDLNPGAKEHQHP